MNRSKMAADILRLVGGKENVASVTNCMTRLRFQLKDHKKADVEALKRLDGVQGVVTKNGQFQVVIGTDVGDVCAELKKLGGFHSDAGAQQSNQDGRVTPKFCVKSIERRNRAKFICRRQRHDRLPPMSTT